MWCHLVDHKESTNITHIFKCLHQHLSYTKMNGMQTLFFIKGCEPVINYGSDLCEKSLFSKLNTPTYHTNLLSNIQTFVSPKPNLYKHL